MERLSFTHLTGTRAYLCLYIEFETQIPFEVLFNVEKNLEVILVDNYGLVAYRSDLPLEFEYLGPINCNWTFTKDAGKLNKEDFLRLQVLCGILPHSPFNKN